MNIIKISRNALLLTALLGSSLYAEDTNTTMTINPGWQLKSFGSLVGYQGYMDTTMMDTVFNNETCINSVWTFDKYSNMWNAYSPNQGIKDVIWEKGLSDIPTFNLNEGFWIITNPDESCTLDLTVLDGLLPATTSFDEIEAMNSQLTIEQGWQLKGRAVGYADMVDFNRTEVDIVWAYRNNGWDAYSPNATLAQQISDNLNINTLTSINAYEGFWVSANAPTIVKKDAILLEPIDTEPLVTVVFDDTAGAAIVNQSNHSINSVALYNLSTEPTQEFLDQLNISITDINYNEVAGTINYDAVNQIIYFNPNITLDEDSTYYLNNDAASIDSQSIYSKSDHIFYTQASGI